MFFSALEAGLDLPAEGDPDRGTEGGGLGPGQGEGAVTEEAGTGDLDPGIEGQDQEIEDQGPGTEGQEEASRKKNLDPCLEDLDLVLKRNQAGRTKNPSPSLDQGLGQSLDQNLDQSPNPNLLLNQDLRG